MIYQETAPIKAVTTQQIHHHLQIDYDNDDGLLDSYALAATQHAEHIMQREIIKRRDPCALAASIADVPPMVTNFILCEVADFYRYRENVQSVTINRVFVHLLDPFILYDRDPDEKAEPEQDADADAGDSNAAD